MPVSLAQTSNNSLSGTQPIHPQVMRLYTYLSPSQCPSYVSGGLALLLQVNVGIFPIPMCRPKNNTPAVSSFVANMKRRILLVVSMSKQNRCLIWLAHFCALFSPQIDTSSHLPVSLIPAMLHFTEKGSPKLSPTPGALLLDDEAALRPLHYRFFVLVSTEVILQACDELISGWYFPDVGDPVTRKTRHHLRI